ncbi:major capsid protein [Rhodococcus zopfii]|uniref:major capsid protein n=1 Tax=Rhodococcus zopfii TaxID=43772 RepID=UPI000933B931|nr:major capsid protein [Rhodococcus zopfii]
MTVYPQQYPFGAPTVSGNNITVDLMLKEPTRINQYLSDLVLKKFFADRIFNNGGGVSGGALVYTQLTKNDLFATTGVQKVAPGAEFPTVSFDRPEPKVAVVEKWGGKFDVTDEARDRNDLSLIQSEGVKLSNTILKQLHTEAIGQLEASITATGAAVQITGTSWSDAAALTLTTTSNAALPAADFAEVSKTGEEFELGTQFNLWLVNPQELANFQVIYGDRWKAVLQSWGVDMFASNLVTAGSAYVVAERQVGEMRFEKPLSTATWREEERETTWVQASVRPVFAVTQPYSVLKVTGLAA